jgi:hypothetical protein
MCHRAAGRMRSIEKCNELIGNPKSERTNKPIDYRGKLSNGFVRMRENGVAVTDNIFWGIRNYISGF